MGNCVETCCLQRENIEELSSTSIKEEKNIEMEKGKTNMRLKVVLTKEELEWLLLQLEFRQGKNLEQVLEEIGRNRGKICFTWKPSLESIIESPEMMDR
ncbi:unnamed protein product [Withania somnifera]